MAGKQLTKIAVLPVRVEQAVIDRVDAWRELYRDKTAANAKELGLPLISRANAVRWFIDLGLDAAEASLKKAKARR